MLGLMTQLSEYMRRDLNDRLPYLATLQACE